MKKKEYDYDVIDNINASSKEQLNDILNFISSNFIFDNTKLSHFRNYRNFLEYINAKGYNINELDADILLSKSCVLKSMIKCIIDEKINIDPLVEALTNVYKTENDEYDLFKEEFVSNSKKDLDLLQLYYSEIKKYNVLTREEEIELFKRYKNGDMYALEKIINHNLKLVIKACKANSLRDMELSDLIQEGNIILMRVIDKFDVNQGYKFSTYFLNCARWHLERVVKNKNRIIRLPIYYYDDLIKLKKVIVDNLEYIDTLDNEKRIEFISKKTGFSKEKIEDLNKNLYDADSFERIVSKNDEEDSEMTFLIDKDYLLEDEVMNKINFEAMMKFINTTNILTNKEKEVLYLRYVDLMKLDEIGKLLGITKEGVRLREKYAFNKLRKSKEFRSYVSQEYLDMEKNNTKRKGKIRL